LGTSTFKIEVSGATDGYDVVAAGAASGVETGNVKGVALVSVITALFVAVF
jgi:hypothetical protein